MRERARQHPDIVVFIPGERLPAAMAIPIDLTIYRCMQESLTNTINHAQTPSASKSAMIDRGADRN